MNIHGLKQKKKKLNEELRAEEEKEYSSRLRVIVLRRKIKVLGKRIKEKRG